MHSGHLLHRDIKPSNILINSDCHARVCDFGLARSLMAQPDKETQPVLTDYICTRWYRSPEILLGSRSYTTGMDLWSIGCIVGELSQGRPFLPGTSTMNQLDRILQVTGYPTSEEVESMRSPFAPNMLESLPKSKPKALGELLPKASSSITSYISRCFAFNPLQRISAKESLRHEYFAQFHNSDDELDCDRAIDPPLDDNTKLKAKDYREEIYNTVLRKKKDQRRYQRKNNDKPQAQQHPHDPREKHGYDHALAINRGGPCGTVCPRPQKLPFDIDGVVSCAANCSTSWSGKTSHR
jgi:mitogen-activated protein kinase 15